MARTRLLFVALVAAVAVGIAAASAGAEVKTTELVSVPPPGWTGGDFYACSVNDYRACETLISADGRRVVFESRGGLAERSAGTTNILSAWSKYNCGVFRACRYAASEDGRHVFFESPLALTPSDGDSTYCYFDTYGSRDPRNPCNDVFEWSGGGYTQISTGPMDSNGPFASSLIGASGDGSHVFFWSYESLIPDNANCSQQCFYDRVDGSTRRVDAEPVWISYDGERVFFLTAAALSPGDTDSCIDRYSHRPRGCFDLYERTGGATELVSTGEGQGNGSYDADFAAASNDGVRVFFTTEEPLLPGDTDSCPDFGGQPRGCRDVYERSGGSTKLISAGPAGANGSSDYYPLVTIAAGHVFFLTDAPLVNGDNDSCHDNQGGGCSDIYDYYQGKVGLVSVGTTQDVRVEHEQGILVSDDARKVFFETEEPLVGLDADACSYGEEGCRDIYERSNGVTSLVSTGLAPHNGPYDARLDGISRDGKRVFFSTQEALSAADRDECGYDQSEGCPDVYERFAGATTLMSTGPFDQDTRCYVNTDGPSCPVYIGASRDGKRVFFATTSSFLSQDTDDLNDIYVSKVPDPGCRPDKPGNMPKKCSR